MPETPIGGSVRGISASTAPSIVVGYWGHTFRSTFWLFCLLAEAPTEVSRTKTEKSLLKSAQKRPITRVQSVFPEKAPGHRKAGTEGAENGRLNSHKSDRNRDHTLLCRDTCGALGSSRSHGHSPGGGVSRHQPGQSVQIRVGKFCPCV